MKASYAAPAIGQASGLGRISRGAVARDTFRDAEGSGAPSRRRVPVALLMLGALMLASLAGAPLASAAVPTILPSVATNVSDSGAGLNANLDPQGLQTSYHFEYGTSSCATSSCTALPAGETGGTGLRLVTRNLNGLQAATTYHFRLIATNASGTTEGPDRTFTTFAPGAKLPDDRAYEMVSPPEKNGANVEPNRSVMASPDGDAVVFGSLGSFAGAPSSPIFNYYKAQRGAGSWSTRGISPPLPPNGLETLASNLMGVSGDFNRSLMQTFGGAPGLSGEPNAFDLYRRDTPDSPLAFGAFENLTELSPPDRIEFFAGADESIGVVGLETPSALTPDAPSNGERKAYVWSAEDAELHYLAIRPDGSPVEFQSEIGAGAQEGVNKNAISPDGSQVIFRAGSALYLRRNPSRPQSPLAHAGATGAGDLESGSAEVKNVTTSTGAFAVGQTIVASGIPFGTTVTAVGPSNTLTLSANALETKVAASLHAGSECTVPADACTVQLSVSATYQGASASGDRILFKTANRLLASDTDDNQDLYLYEPGPDTLRRISVDSNSADGTGAEVVQVMALGDDAHDAYFAAVGSLVPGQPEPAGIHIYVWHDDGTPGGSLSYITTLDEALDGGPNGDWSGRSDLGHGMPTLVQASPNGRFFVYTAKTQQGAYDNVKPGGCGFIPEFTGLVPDPDPHCSEIYRYDSVAHDLDCVSCDPSGETATGDAVLWNGVASAFSGIDKQGFVSHNVDNSGRVFFNTEDGLTPTDRNDLFDVYEWKNGEISLISRAGESPATFANATPSGDDVFFNTTDQLVGWDADTNIDLYDARVGGGLPEPPPAAESCEGDACQPPPPSLNDPTPSSSSFAGPGNVRTGAQARCPKGRRKVHAKGKSRCAKGAKHKKGNRANHNRRASR